MAKVGNKKLKKVLPKMLLRGDFMKITDFYRKRISEIKIEILEAKNKRDFKQVVKLEAEKAEWEKRLHE